VRRKGRRMQEASAVETLITAGYPDLDSLRIDGPR
jgi:hypothetical protein